MNTETQFPPAVNEFAELGLVPIQDLELDRISPSPENDKLYRPISEDDPEIEALAESIRKNGVMEPLVVTMDPFIVSGHRRYAAAKLAGVEFVPCRVLPFMKDDAPDRFMTLLREFNRQREKTTDEKIREEVISANPEETYQSLIEHRQQQAVINVVPMTIRAPKGRAEITEAKRPFLDAIVSVLYDLRPFWPVAERSVHYNLLNNPPLRHASKPDSVYRNDKPSNKSLCDLMLRARLRGLIPMEAIMDETRPVCLSPGSDGTHSFIRGELDNFLKGYWRNLMQSQPNHIEILVEKNTVLGILKSVAMEYCIPITSGRGFCSLPPRHAMAERFRKSGKDKLVLIIASDFDPEGEEIAHSFARSMRDDFEISNIHAVKATITPAQVQRFNLPPQMVAKESSTNYSRFVRAHGRNTFELEALKPEILQQMVRETIDSVIDVDAFNAELDREKKDSAELEVYRRRVFSALGGLGK